MKDYCEKHNNIELVLIWVVAGDSTKKLVKLCPKCHNLSNVKYTCSKCKWKNSLWLNKKTKVSSIKCERCGDTGVRGVPFMSVRDIPSWRLNIDDSKPGEILESSAEKFGMKPMSAEDWKAYYESEHEQKKLTEFNKQKKKFTKETLGSPNFAIPKDTKTS